MTAIRNYFEEARSQPGVTGTLLLQLLERRLDNVVYRLGFAQARPQARQWVRHGHFTANGRKVNIPSYRVRPGEVVAWSEHSTKLPFFGDAARSLGQRPVPGWLTVDRSAMSAAIVRQPETDEMERGIDTRLIVEHYSR